MGRHSDTVLYGGREVYISILHFPFPFCPRLCVAFSVSHFSFPFSVFPTAFLTYHFSRFPFPVLISPFLVSVCHFPFSFPVPIFSFLVSRFKFPASGLCLVKWGISRRETGNEKSENKNGKRDKGNEKGK